MRKIIIFGDSWSEGTFKYIGNKRVAVDNLGLQLLHKKYNMINFSKGGSSNWQSLNSIFNYCNNFVVDDSDIILLCQTDLFRSKGSDLFDVDYSKFYKNSNNLVDFYNTICEIFYYKLDSVASEFNKKIYLIGGLSDIDTRILSMVTDKVSVIASSWIKLLDNQHIESSIPVVINPNFMPEARKNGRDDLASEAFEFSEKNFMHYTNLQSTEYIGNFISDFHPTELGHDIMATEILKYFGDNI
jgi:hypothetical protein